jgi:hypothetical protein
VKAPKGKVENECHIHQLTFLKFWCQCTSRKLEGNAKKSSKSSTDGILKEKLMEKPTGSLFLHAAAACVSPQLSISGGSGLLLTSRASGVKEHVIVEQRSCLARLNRVLSVTLHHLLLYLTIN